MESIIKDGNRAAEVIRHVRALTNKTEMQKAPLDINDVVGLLKVRPSTIAATRDLGADPMRAFVDVTRRSYAAASSPASSLHFSFH